MPSFAPSTAARNQPARWLLWSSITCLVTDTVGTLGQAAPGAE
jgi:hypothetical protein